MNHNDDMNIGSHVLLESETHSVLCACSADAALRKAGALDDRRFDWFLAAPGDDRWVAFFASNNFDVGDAQRADARMHRDHGWRIEMVGRPIREVLAAPGAVAVLQVAVLGNVTPTRAARLRGAPAHRVHAASGLKAPLPAAPPPAPTAPAMPRDPFLHRVSVSKALPAHAARLRRCDILTLGQAARCTRERLLDLPGIGERTVDALERALTVHGAGLAERGGDDLLPTRMHDDRDRLHAMRAAGMTMATIAAELDLSRTYVREVLCMARPLRRSRS